MSVRGVVLPTARGQGSRMPTSRKFQGCMELKYAKLILAPAYAACGVNFTLIPYEPSGECIHGINEKINDWEGVPTSSCRRNAFNTLSHALARQATTGDGIFIDGERWKKCNNPFHQQQSVSVQTCGLDDLFYGSSQCSSLELSTFKQNPIYQDAFHQCASFSPSFDDACNNCTKALINARNQFLDQLNARENDTEKVICGAALIIAVAAGEIDSESLIEDFYQCLLL
ncbi:hypothetical protein ACH5RR_018730 [Cinchona calisaya]|uniref:Uncharacterized protein n=1 Tax=Cinchona calisaya TaxID=153742 RepID=A0ABD2ZMA6_9GENT